MLSGGDLTHVYNGPELAIGMPLGGLGTGYTVLEGDGRLGDTTIFNDFPAAYTLRQPPRLHTEFIAVKPKDQPVLVLATQGERLSSDTAWASSIRYSGNFPFARLDYAFPGTRSARLSAWAPFVLGDAAVSNTPAVVLDLHLDLGPALGNEQVEVAVRFPKQIDGGAGHVTGAGQTTVTWTAQHFGRDCGQSLSVLGARLSRAGTMELDSMLSGNWQLGEATDNVSAVFAVDLDANGRGELTVIHSWFYPDYQIGDAFPYSHMYGKRFNNVADVARFTTTQLPTLRQRSLAWQDILAETDYPDWLIDALVNSLYCLAKNSWWNVDDSIDSGWSPDGLFTLNETFRDCPVTNTIPCHYFAHLPVLWFFPDLERTTLEAFARYQLVSGEIPFALAYGSGLYDPRYHCVHPSNSAMFIELVARYYRRTGDRQWIQAMFPTLQRALSFTKSLDVDDDGLIEEQPHPLPGTFWPANNYHDAFPWRGAAAHTNGIWLSALKAYAEIAADLQEHDQARHAQAAYEAARTSYDDTLWTGSYYRLHEDTATGTGRASLTNQLVGEWSRIVSGADQLMPSERILSALNTVIRLNVQPFFLPTEAVLPDGTAVTVGGAVGGDTLHQEQGRACMVSEAICAAVTLIANGHTDQGLEIVNRQWFAQAIRWATPFSQYYLLTADTGQPVWGNDYLSNLVVWSILSVMDQAADQVPVPAVVTRLMNAADLGSGA